MRLLQKQYLTMNSPFGLFTSNIPGAQFYVPQVFWCLAFHIIIECATVVAVFGYFLLLHCASLSE